MLFQFLLTKFSKSEPVFKSKLITWPTIAKGLLRGKQQRLPRVFPLPFSMVNALRMGLAPKVLSFAKASWCHQEAATKQVKSTYESSGPSGRSLFLFLWHEMTRNILFFFSLFFLFSFFAKSVLQGAKKLSPREIKNCVSHQPHPQSRPYNWPLMRVFFTHEHHNIRAGFQSTRHMAYQGIIKGPLGQVCQNIIFIFIKAWFSKESVASNSNTHFTIIIFRELFYWYITL